MKSHFNAPFCLYLPAIKIISTIYVLFNMIHKESGLLLNLQSWHYKPTPPVELIANLWLTWLLCYDALLQPCGRLGKCISREERRQQWWCELGRVAVHSSSSLSPVAIDKAITHSSPLWTPVFIGTETNEVSRCSSSSNTELCCEHAAFQPRRAGPNHLVRSVSSKKMEMAKWVISTSQHAMRWERVKTGRHPGQDDKPPFRLALWPI